VLFSAGPVRGDDLGHYASISAIRQEADFTNAVNLKDVDVDQQRRAAETEINSDLASNHTVQLVLDEYIRRLSDLKNLQWLTDALVLGCQWLRDRCDDDSCPVVIGGVLVYRDQHHLTVLFAETLAPLLMKQMEENAA